jgi:hypothetical protein
MSATSRAWVSSSRGGDGGSRNLGENHLLVVNTPGLGGSKRHKLCRLVATPSLTLSCVLQYRRRGCFLRRGTKGGSGIRFWELRESWQRGLELPNAAGGISPG